MVKLRRLLLVLAVFSLCWATGVHAATIFLKARLDGAQAAVATAADGSGIFSYDTATRSLSWVVNYRGLSSPFTAAHFHGPAGRGVVAPALVPIAFSASPLVGSATLTASQEADMLAGLWYVNIHTTTYPDGEIRGQLAMIKTFLYSVTLDGAQAGQPGAPIATPGSGSGTVSFDPAVGVLSWNITYSNLTSSTTAAHFHGPAKPFEAAAAIVPTGTASPISGSATLSPAQAAEFVNGFWYHNIHTTNFPNGEIRGQVLPIEPHLSAIATRMQVFAGENVLIGGFVIGGSLPKTVVVRARGPSLVAAGVVGALMDPTLAIVPAAGGVPLTNDDWQTDPNAAALTASGLAPTEPKEAAIMVTLPPGAYTAVVAGAGRTTGIGLVEVYEMDHPEAPLIGIATRGLVQLGQDVMIGGIIIQGLAPQTVVLRARGPSLAAQGVALPLSNPALFLVRASDGAVIAANDDWGSDVNAATLSAIGFAPADPRESAMLITLDPGAYTIVVVGVNNTVGVALVEAYAVP